MRVRRFILLVAAPLMAAACASESAPPLQTPSPEVTAEATVDTGIGGLETLAAENSILITPPVPGTLSVADTVRTPNYTPAPLDFSTVTYVRAGGIAGEMLLIRLYSDGRLDVNDEQTSVSIEQVESIRRLLDEVRFYEIGGVFTGPAPVPDAYNYSIGVAGSRGALTITAQDGFVPPELERIFRAMEALVPAQP